MMSNPATIEKNPTLLPSEDYYFLRRKGIEFIEQMGSRWWTDYNSHDPGITLLEALCYAITDLGYRTGWDIKDILAEPSSLVPDHERQAFFSAKKILPCNPLTVNDFRKILIDLEAVRNAWLICKDCACEVQLYAHCEESRLAYQHPAKQKEVIKVPPLGTYDVLLELEQDPELGDLNDRKILHTLNLPLADGTTTPVTLEVRFPRWNDNDGSFYHLDNAGDIVWDFPWESIANVTVLNLSRNKSGLPLTQEEIRRGWSGVFYATLQVDFSTVPAQSLTLEPVALRLHGSQAARQALTPTDIESLLENSGEEGTIVKRFFRKKTAVAQAVVAAKERLHEVRNLCEDFCCTSQVCVEDVAVCADVEVTPDADIERVLADILFQIEDYFNPPVPFFSLAELQAEKMPVEQIFEGPVLKHGFIKTADLEVAQLKTQLRTSDLINRLVDIEGVVAVKNLLLTRYDDEGNPVLGVADHGNPKQMSARWTLAISPRCQPRLYLEHSKFLFYKNDLPFLPRLDEVRDTLQQRRGEAERLKIKNAADDLAVPVGEFRSPDDYFPVQYSLPLTYGTGPAGLPDRASARRRAQAKQLKAFLLFAEQLLANYLAQLAHVKDLFALDETVQRTYFTKDLNDPALIDGVTDLFHSGYSPAELDRLAEGEAEFLDRRNRFLDHLLGRFAESFADYALALYSFETQLPLLQEDLIKNKIRFLKEYPAISGERARAFNYKIPPATTNFPGLKKRIARLLGFDDAMEEKMMLIEHILLRPRFFGDALMPVCLDATCATCGEEDPYSFQMTLVMPGWMEPFDKNLDLRRFADRTIRLETPAHILVKICWVGDESYGLDPSDPIFTTLANLLQKEGLLTDGTRPDFKEACYCATFIVQRFQEVFETWIAEREFEHHTATATRAALHIHFAAAIPSSDPAFSNCTLTNPDDFFDAVLDMLSDFFTHIAQTGRQHTKLKHAWEAWLEASRRFEWCETNIKARVERELEKFKPTVQPGIHLRRQRVDCACQILERFGEAMYERTRIWFEQPDSLKPLSPEQEIALVFETAFPGKAIQCGYLTWSGQAYDELKNRFVLIFKDFLDVTRRLWLLIDVLSKLNSIYPAATLHDCDDGSDINPVRLGNTALGSN